jgi:hypothetical protein
MRYPHRHTHPVPQLALVSSVNTPRIADSFFHSFIHSMMPAGSPEGCSAKHELVEQDAKAPPVNRRSVSSSVDHLHNDSRTPRSMQQPQSALSHNGFCRDIICCKSRYTEGRFCCGSCNRHQYAPCSNVTAPTKLIPARPSITAATPVKCNRHHFKPHPPQARGTPLCPQSCLRAQRARPAVAARHRWAPGLAAAAPARYSSSGGGRFI